MDKRLFPVTPEFFGKHIEPVINRSYIWKGRPPVISHYKVFCAILYVLRTGVAWRDLPGIYGNWHSIYMRFARGNDKCLWWKILMALQADKVIKLNIVLCDSSSFKVHRHGGGLKKRNAE
jgi:transposase